MKQYTEEKTGKMIQIICAEEKRRRFRYLTVMSSMAVITISCCILMLVLGNTNYSLHSVFEVFQGGGSTQAQFAILIIRLPRLLTGLMAGFAFGVSGSVFQTMLRNPLANPDILGITYASSAGALFCLLILHQGSTFIFFGSIGAALLTVGMIVFFSSLKRFSIARLILVGIGFQAMMLSVINYLILIGNEKDLSAAVRWMSGSLNGASMSGLIPLFAACMIVIPYLFFQCRALKGMELGEESAKVLGIATEKVRRRLLTAAVILAAVATATTGPIAFVAFLSGPIAKRLIGYGNSSPAAGGLFGSLLVLFSDLAGQHLFTLRFPVGIITGLAGAPYLIFLLMRMNRQGEM